MNIDKLNEMRDCVRKAYLNGCSPGHEFVKMRHAIIAELKRLGYETMKIKDELLEWNKRCEKPLDISEQKIQLLGYVDWFERNNCRTGCKTLEDYCIEKDKCLFYRQSTAQSRSGTPALLFDISLLEKFLSAKYGPAKAREMILIVKAVRKFQLDKATGEIIYIGYRTIGSIIRDTQGHTLYHMDICRKVNLLVTEQVIQKVSKGKRGNYSKLANAYRFLRWPPRGIYT